MELRHGDPSQGRAEASSDVGAISGYPPLGTLSLTFLWNSKILDQERIRISRLRQGATGGEHVAQGRRGGSCRLPEIRLVLEDPPWGHKRSFNDLH